MDFLPYIFAGVLIVLTIVLAVVGVQLILVLQQVRLTILKINRTLDTAEEKFQAIAVPLQHLSGTATGLRTGFKVFEGFLSWLQRDKQKE